MYRKSLENDLKIIFDAPKIEFNAPQTIENEKNTLFVNIENVKNTSSSNNKIKAIINGKLFILGQNDENKEMRFFKNINNEKNVKILNKFVFFGEEENINLGDFRFNAFSKKFSYFYEEDFVKEKYKILGLNLIEKIKNLKNFLNI